ncbi:EAL domain-containing protein [Kushneria indalinina]|uniref:EAL domain-containing protein (Putative c-di-GMP-specific phosphodiesterase class I) n=1 Tax=Kushneria indalinina DSM 14324 TaxID=1122140 RepID=A0A3D9DXP5_9GAMM|nr:EAL domain-containing protein [Kushneria indalinina]REC95550.1 EAL domain-containing protein (putative c-di-GMP-specific phosphodiesterase class I) [Kushneria indalinina DSM 14324]
MRRTVQALCHDIRDLADELAAESASLDEKRLTHLSTCRRALSDLLQTTPIPENAGAALDNIPLSQYERMLLCEHDVIWHWEAQGDALTLSSHWQALYHGTPADSLTQWCQTLHPRDRDRVHALCHQAASAQGVSRVECRLRDGQGQWRFIRLRIVGNGAEGQPGLTGVVSDITHERYRDPVTGLGNSELLNQLLEDALADTAGTRHALVKITMVNATLLSESEHFNNTRELETRIADLLADLLPAGRLIALPGFSYALVTPFQCQTALKRFLEPLQQMLGMPLETPTGRVWLSHVVGVVPFDGGCHVGAETLRKRARLTVNNASGTGVGGIHYYSDELYERARRASRGEQLIRAALACDGVLCFLQPIVSVREGGRVVAFEALMRLRDGEEGIALPGAFIEAAESTGLIHQLSQQLIDKALHILVDPAFTDRFGQDFVININLSRHQLKDVMLVDDMMTLIHKHGADPRRVNLEITESAVLAEPAIALRNLVRLREHGISIALDDFGSGYSSLSQLCELPLDCIKIDRRFVMDLEHEPRKRHVMTSVIDLCRRLEFRVVVEGVEECATLRTVCDMGAEQIQGFIYARPMPSQDVLGRLNATLLPMPSQPVSL